jgi:hypothetical protein
VSDGFIWASYFVVYGLIVGYAGMLLMRFRRHSEDR